MGINGNVRYVGIIPEGVNLGYNMSLRGLLRVGSITEVLNMGLDTVFIDSKN